MSGMRQKLASSFANHVSKISLAWPLVISDDLSPPPKPRGSCTQYGLATCEVWHSYTFPFLSYCIYKVFSWTSGDQKWPLTSNKYNDFSSEYDMSIKKKYPLYSYLELLLLQAKQHAHKQIKRVRDNRQTDRPTNEWTDWKNSWRERQTKYR